MLLCSSFSALPSSDLGGTIVSADFHSNMLSIFTKYAANVLMPFWYIIIKKHEEEEMLLVIVLLYPT